MDVRVSADPASEAAAHLIELVRAAIESSGSAAIAVSGGSTAPPLFEAMAAAGSDVTVDTGDGSTELWGELEVWQVDERIAPDGDPDRNAGQLDALPAAAHPMPVTDPDFARAIAEYAASLPERFDVVHLGLGDDGHTASWPPRPHPDADRVLTAPAPVFTVEEFNGRRRMTLGVDVVNGAAQRIVLVRGANKADAVGRWIRGLDEHGGAWVDPTLPIAVVEPDQTVLFLDADAASSLER